MRIIDLRSDTVTLPDEGMRAAVAAAPLGDDVFGEDPSINRLQEESAALLGKEAGLYLPSGSMANLAALLAFCERGDEIILGDRCHIFQFEAGSTAAVGGLHVRTLPNADDGTLSLEDIAAAVRPAESHHPRSRLVALENTHNRCWGSPLSPEYTRSVSDLAKAHGLLLYLDGARIFNAAAALGVEAKELAAPADAVSFCLSKGLAAPVGSVLCGSREFVDRAHRMRKQLGGGMRQAGFLAAAGLYALEHRLARLPEDHASACLLAEGLSRLPGVKTEPERVGSNIVFFDLERDDISGKDLLAAAGEKGLLFLSEPGSRFRLVTHFGIESDDIEAALAILAEILG